MERSDLRRARAAYERAMIVRAALGAWPVVPLVAAALVLHGPARAPSTIVAIGGALAIAVIAAGWRGGAWRRGAWSGLVGGVPLFLVPTLFARAGDCSDACAAGPPTSCIATCAVVGVVVGAALGVTSRHEPVRLVAAAAIAGAVGSLTCVAAGGAAVIAAAAGLLTGTAPVLLFARRA